MFCSRKSLYKHLVLSKDTPDEAKPLRTWLIIYPYRPFITLDLVIHYKLFSHYLLFSHSIYFFFNQNLLYHYKYLSVFPKRENNYTFHLQNCNDPKNH